MADISWVKTGDRYIVNKSGIYHGATLTKGNVLEITTARYTEKELDASVYVDTVGAHGSWVLSPKMLLEVCTMVTKDATTREVQEGDVYTVNTDFSYSGAKVKKGTILTVRKHSGSHTGSFMVEALPPTGRSRTWSINKNSILASCTLHSVEKELKPKVEERSKTPVKRLDQKDFMSALDGI